MITIKRKQDLEKMLSVLNDARQGREIVVCIKETNEYVRTAWIGKNGESGYTEIARINPDNSTEQEKKKFFKTDYPDFLEKERLK